MSSKTADVIIVGAGIVGNSAAYYLRKMGRSCIVLEETMIGHGGSSRNGGGVRQSGRDIREFPLAAYAVKNIWPNLSEELGIDVEYRQNGYLVCGYDDSQKKMIEERMDIAKSFGVNMELMSEKDIRERFPYISQHVICAGWTPSDGIANPMVTTIAFYIRAKESGATFITGEKVVKINKVKGVARQVVTENGNIYEGDKIIVAAGYYSKKFLKTVGIDIPVQKKLSEVIVTEAAPRLFDHMIGGMTGFYGQQTKHGSFVFGSTSGREMFMFDRERTVSTPQTPSFICNSLVQDIPALKNLKVIRTWSGWIDVCMDGVPIVGKIDEVPGLIVSVASSGHGFCPGPAVGFTLAELACDKESTVDISKLHFDRFDYAKKQNRYLTSKEGGYIA